MIRTTTSFAKAVAVTCTVLMVNLAIPMGLPKVIADHWPESHPAPKVVKGETKPLTAKEMRSASGRWAKNPYVAGSNKWSVSYKGVDLLTGNFTTSGTDMTFEGGYGIPVNITGSYSANDPDEGPLGLGWNLSVDVRSTAGGVVKSSGGPVRAVPTGFKERPSAQTNDPNAEAADGSAVQPPEAVLATDASGKEETEQRDVDGIITTPPWDKNTNDPVYEEVVYGGSTYKILVSNDTTTPDGTVYHYAKEGFYAQWDSGTSTWIRGDCTSFDGAGSGEPSNVLKVTTVTDRQGNVTTYHYNSTYVTFAKTNGTTREYQLDYITMPNGHRLNFTWGNGTTAPTNRIYTADDNVTGGRTVTYGYDSSGNLTSVTTPEGLVTGYGYGDATAAYGSTHTTDLGSDMITSITDPRGLVTSVYYTEEDSVIAPYGVSMKSARGWRLVSPNGVTTDYAHDGTAVPSASYWNTHGQVANTGGYCDIAYGETDPFQEGWMRAQTISGTVPVFDSGMGGVGGQRLPSVHGAETWRKQYDARSQDLLWEEHSVSPMATSQTTARLMDRSTSASDYKSRVETTTSYNFMGNPLSKTITESQGKYSGSYTNTRVQTTDYAYWGGDKYFQQKATRIQTGSSTYRYTMTDYFDSSSAAGAKGQTKAVYSPAFTSFTTTQGSQPDVPSGTDSSDYWRYWLQPSDSTTAAAKFYDGSGNPAYDSKGRVTDVWKLQSTSTTPWTYVQTHTAYGADNDGSWGQASDVWEDYGSGHINRHTQTLHYTSWGQADQVEDAAGHVFETTYDRDGKIQSVARTDGTSHTVVSYTYGTSGLTNGQVTEITDGLSGAVQDFTYCSSGGGKGQIASVSESDPGSIS